jgi:hypothetical protein
VWLRERPFADEMESTLGGGKDDGREGRPWEVWPAFTDSRSNLGAEEGRQLG